MDFLSVEDFHEHAFLSGWTDGLPVLPPEASAVNKALEAADADPKTGLLQQDGLKLSVGDVAVASVLAGCEPSYFPVVVAAVQAFIEGFVRQPAVPTVADSAHCIVVNGPVRNRLNVNCGLGLYGPGWRANATIGRALRLVVASVVSDVVPSFGAPGQLTLCFGEDEENSRWTPLHVERGFESGESAVTVFPTIVSSLLHDRHSESPEELLDSLVAFARGRVSGAGWFGGDQCSLLLIFPEESKRVLGSLSKKAVRDYLYPRLIADDGTPIHPVRLSSPDDLLVVAAGGPAFSVVQLMMSHRFAPITKPVQERKEGPR